MKCIKNKSGKIERVSNAIAQERVNNGDWVYIPKHEYKAQERTNKNASGAISNQKSIEG